MQSSRICKDVLPTARDLSLESAILYREIGHGGMWLLGHWEKAISNGICKKTARFSLSAAFTLTRKLRQSSEITELEIKSHN